MAHEEKSNRNTKKAATKAAKVHGAPKVPKYAQNDSSMTPPDLSPKAKKR